MADRVVCVGDNLDVNADGALTIAPWAGVQSLGAYSTAAASTDNGVSTSLPGRLMVSGSLLVRNDSPSDRDVLTLWSRPWVRLRVAQPNAVQVRMMWTHTVRPSVPPEVIPNPSNEYDAAFTASVDVGTDGIGIPKFGHLTREYPGGLARHVEHVPAGQWMRVCWSVYGWNPPPYANNAAANNPLVVRVAGGYTVQAFALPNTDGSTV